MKVTDTSDIRNVALLGHGASGKTTLASAMLFVSGAVNRLGRVDEGNTITDFDEEEIERKISLQTALAHHEWKKKKVNILDTPGYAAFVADAKAALTVADAALVLVDAVAGVQVITERTYKYAEDLGLPVIFVASKMDRERASADETGYRADMSAHPPALVARVVRDGGLRQSPDSGNGGKRGQQRNGIPLDRRQPTFAQHHREHIGGRAVAAGGHRAKLQESQGDLAPRGHPAARRLFSLWGTIDHGPPPWFTPAPGDPASPRARGQV